MDQNQGQPTGGLPPSYPGQSGSGEAQPPQYEAQPAQPAHPGYQTQPTPHQNPVQPGYQTQPTIVYQEQPVHNQVVLQQPGTAT